MEEESSEKQEGTEKRQRATRQAGHLRNETPGYLVLWQSPVQFCSQKRHVVGVVAHEGKAGWAGRGRHRDTTGKSQEAPHTSLHFGHPFHV